MVASNRQQAIYDMWTNSNNNIVIGAVAGSGKSTTLLEMISLIPGRILFLAFNNSIQKELQSKIEKRDVANIAKAVTIHKLGLDSIKKVKKVIINANKKYDLLKKLEQKFQSVYRGMAWEDRMKVNYSIMDVNDSSRMYLTNDLEQLGKIMEANGKYISNHSKFKDLWEAFLEIRELSYAGNKIVIDFEDMIYLPVHLDLQIAISPKFLFVDEAQDLNICQHALIDKLINQGVEKWVAVGDKNQSIYGFSGAYSGSFNLFLEKENTVSMPLDICYRCPTSVIDEANEVYDSMEYGTDEEGEVTISNSVYDIIQGSMVVCRNKGPLIDLYFELIGMHKDAYLMGSDILMSILRSLKPYTSKTVAYMLSDLEHVLEELKKDTSEKGRIKLAWFKEDYDNTKKICLHLAGPSTKVKELVDKVNSLFEPKPDAIVLCTIHKSKGLESNYVYILNKKLIPNKFATTKEQLIQEKNLLYVAITRAKKALCYLNLDGND